MWNDSRSVEELLGAKPPFVEPGTRLEELSNPCEVSYGTMTDANLSFRGPLELIWLHGGRRPVC